MFAVVEVLTVADGLVGGMFIASGFGSRYMVAVN